jgi:ankyrin repeat protein
VHARSVNGLTALLFAARDGDVASVRLLLDAGADVNEAAPDATTPLLAAAHNLRADVAAALLERGANANAADISGLTPLHAAVWKHVGQVGLVQDLVAHGADPNARAKRPPRALPGEIGNFRSNGSLAGVTPFLLASKFADTAVMRALANGGANPRLTTDDGTTALMLAAGMGRSEGIDQNTAGEFARALDAVKLAIELGVDVNAANRAGQTAMHAAASTSGDQVIEYLASKGANVDVKDTKGNTPLALTYGDTDFALTTRVSTAALLRKLGAQPIPGRQ